MHAPIKGSANREGTRSTSMSVFNRSQKVVSVNVLYKTSSTGEIICEFPFDITRF